MAELGIKMDLKFNMAFLASSTWYTECERRARQVGSTADIEGRYGDTDSFERDV